MQKSNFISFSVILLGILVFMLNVFMTIKWVINYSSEYSKSQIRERIISDFTSTGYLFAFTLITIGIVVWVLHSKFQKYKLWNELEPWKKTGISLCASYTILILFVYIDDILCTGWGCGFIKAFVPSFPWFLIYLAVPSYEGIEFFDYGFNPVMQIIWLIAISLNYILLYYRTNLFKNWKKEKYYLKWWFWLIILLFAALMLALIFQPQSKPVFGIPLQLPV